MTTSKQPAARLAQHAGELAFAVLLTPRMLTALSVLVAVFAAGRRRRTRQA